MDQVTQDQQLVTDFIAERPLEAGENTKGWKLLFTEQEMLILNDYVAREINRRFAGQSIVIATILKGAVYFLVDLTRRITIPYSLYFIEASSYHNAQTQSEEVELLSKIVPSKFSGKKVILIDELFDNGTTLAKVKAKLLETPDINITSDDVFTVTLFQKDKVVAYPSPDLVGYAKLPDLWVVGYGLDDGQEKRGWKHLFAIPKSPGIPHNHFDKIFEDTPEGKTAYNNLRALLIADVKALQIQLAKAS